MLGLGLELGCCVRCQTRPVPVARIHANAAACNAGCPKYRCADNLAICPDNPAAVVESVAARLKVSLDEQFVLEARDPGKGKDLKPLFPTPCTVRRAFTRYVDLCGIPKK